MENEITTEAYIASLENAIQTFDKNKDSGYFRYPSAFELYCETTLTLNEIAKLLEIPEPQVIGWHQAYKWEAHRKDMYPVMNQATINVLEKNTTKAKLKYSKNIHEQLTIVGNQASQKAFDILAGTNTLEDKDTLNFFVKVKDLEARVSGQIRPATTNININNNSIYRKIMENGFDDAYTDAMDAECEELISPQPKQLPDHVSKSIPEYKERFTKLSDEEAAEYLDRPFG
jgi:hypothetical protein